MGDTLPVPFILSCPQVINWKQRHSKYTVTYTPKCVNDMWNKSYMNCGNEIKMKNDRRREKKSSGLQRGLNAVEVLNFFQSFLRNCINCVSLRRSFLHFHLISAIHIWFISYIINIHFFHGNIWTHNWPAPNVSGFIAQLVEHRAGIVRSRVKTPLKS